LDSKKDLGRATAIVVFKENTTIIEGEGKTRIQAASRRFRRQIEETPSDYDRKKAPRTPGQARRWRCRQSIGRDRDALKKRKPAWKTPCTRPVRPSRKASSLAAVWPHRRKVLDKLELTGDELIVAKSFAAPSNSPCARSSKSRWRTLRRRQRGQEPARVTKATTSPRASTSTW